MLDVSDPRCGDCRNCNLDIWRDSGSTRFLMKIYDCKKTGQFVSLKRVICKDFDPRHEL
jgi:hypothetical protein